MAWSISMSAEGWDDIYKSLSRWSKERLINAIADDYYEDLEQQGKFPEEINAEVEDYKGKISKLTQDVLVDTAFTLIRQNDSCDNGGWAFWIDRNGYHRVSLSY